MILIRDLTKRYSSTVAANHVNLAVLPGEITVLLGPNGAGKSTTIKSIAGLLKHEGTITICGQPSKSMEARQILGYIPETPGLYDLLTVQEHVEFIRRAYCLGEDTLKRAQDLMVRFELDDKKDKMGKELSKGMGQKVSLLLGLMIQPKAVVVDEPMVGLDPKAIEELSALFVELKQAGVAVLISTHIIDMMESLWDRAYIMDKGCIAACAVREGNAAVPADVTADAVDFVSNMAFQEIAGDHLKPMFFQITGGGANHGS